MSRKYAFIASEEGNYPMHGRGAGPPQGQVAAAAGPPALLVVFDPGEAELSEIGSRVQRDADTAVVVDGQDSAQQYGAAPSAWEGEGFAAFEDAVVSDPAATPDHAAFFVEDAPHEPIRRRERLAAGAADGAIVDALSFAIGDQYGDARGGGHGGDGGAGQR